jgi:hypothetical protein
MLSTFANCISMTFKSKLLSWWWRTFHAALHIKRKRNLNMHIAKLPSNAQANSKCHFWNTKNAFSLMKIDFMQSRPIPRFISVGSCRSKVMISTYIIDYLITAFFKRIQAKSETRASCIPVGVRPVRNLNARGKSSTYFVFRIWFYVHS